MIDLSRTQLLVVLTCVESEIQRVEEFIADHGGTEDPINKLFVFWLSITSDAQSVLISQQEK
jgi:hypothetical protein